MAEEHDVEGMIVGEVPAGRRATVPLLVAVVAALMLWTSAPRLHAGLFPILGEQHISDVVRTPARLCWERLSFKNYARAVENYDVFLDRVDARTGQFSDQHRSFPEIFAEATGEPISTDRAPGVGWSRRRHCVQLPPNVMPDQPIRLRQIAHFAGLFDLYDVPMPLPEIVSPGIGMTAATQP